MGSSNLLAFFIFLFQIAHKLNYLIIPMQIFFTTDRYSFENWEISLEYSPLTWQSHGMFRPIMCEQKYLMDYIMADILNEIPVNQSDS